MDLWGFEIWATALGFARIGAIVMLLPGFGEPAIPANARLAFALMLSVVMSPDAVAMPATVLGMAGLLIGEIIIGLMIGALARMVMSALAVAGQIIGLETGLAFAQTTDPTAGQAGIVVGVFLSLLGLTLIFATGLHHMFLLAIRDSYGLFTPGQLPSPGDAAEVALRSVADAFRIGLQIAAPLVVAGFVFRLGLGVLSRLIPSIQVFMVAMPLNILGGFLIMMLGLSAGMLVWLSHVDQFSVSFR
jgi:flagellar biosynthetic protein FliR